MSATPSPPAEVSVIGTGSMGSAIARELLTRGYSVTVWNRTAGKTSALEDLGAKLAPSASDALAASPVSIVVLMDYDTVIDLVAAAPPLAGRTLVNVTTGGPADAIRLEQAIAGNGGRFLDAALFFYPPEVGQARSALRFSGSEESWREHRTLLTTLGGDAAYLGSDVTLANSVDGAWIGFFIPALAAAMEAAVYGAARGVEFATVIDTMRTVLPVIDGFLTEAQAKIASQDFTADNGLDLYITSLLTVLRPMESMGLPGYLGRATIDLMEDVKRTQGGELDFSVIVRELLGRTGRAAPPTG